MSSLYISGLSLWPSHWQYQAIEMILVTSLLCILTYAVTSFQFNRVRRSRASVKTPPTLPYWIPILGHTFSVLFDNMKLNSYIAERYTDIPVRIKLFFLDIYIITGPEHITSIFRQSQTVFPLGSLVRRRTLHNIFGTPSNAGKIYDEDNSGSLSKPLPGTNVKPHNRVNYIHHHSLTKWLTGPGLKELAERFSENLIEQLRTTKELTTEWTELPDLLKFMQHELFYATSRAFLGDELFTLNPRLAEDVWEFDKGVPYLAKGIPRWAKPSVYRARDKAVQRFVSWHKWVRNYVEREGMPEDPQTIRKVFGNDFMKTRFEAFWKMDYMSSVVEGPASEDFMVTWGANANSVPAAFWFIFHILHSPSLLSTVREQIKPCVSISSDSKLDIDITALCANPLLQSAYMEIMRLYISLTLIRDSEESDLCLNEWIIPKKSLILIPGQSVHRSQKLWEGIGKAGTEESSPYPSVDTFCAERFLKYPEKGGEPFFSAENLTGYWIPYSGGSNICLGRYYAKQEIIGAMAIMLTLFDIEILGDENIGEPDAERIFGFGVMKPKRSVPVRMRRRQV